MKILVVDDDELSSLACSRALEAKGHRIVRVSSSAAALEALESSQFDLLITDIKMPVRDGLHLIEAARGRFRALPVLATSGYPTEETASNSYARGADGFIPKPFTPAELLQAVEAAHAARAAAG